MSSLKALPWWLLAALILALVLTGLWMSRVTIDLSWLSVTLAVVVVAWVLYRISLHFFTPQHSYVIETSVHITDPLIPYMGRRTFHADIRVRDSSKGKRDTVSRKTIKVAFRGKNAEQFRSECMALLSQALEEQQAMVKKKDPQAVVVVQDTPQELINALPAIEA